MSSLNDEVKRLAGGRELSPFDLTVFETVAGLSLRLQEARALIEAEGLMVEGPYDAPVEHPALAIEKRTSQELRGWVDKRPDLFGPVKSKPAPGRAFPGLRAVSGD